MGAISLLADLTELAAATAPAVSLQVGESTSHTRFYAVGSDIAQITDAIVALDGVPHRTLEAVVEGPEGTVPGARVHVLNDGEPWSMAFTDGDGTVSLSVPEDGEIEVLAEGRGNGMFLGLAPGASPYSPYAAEWLRTESLASLSGNAEVIPQAVGRGVGTLESPLWLESPGTLLVEVGDNLPFEVRIYPLDERPELDGRIANRRFSVDGAMAWGRQGLAKLILEPGAYRVHVHRGIRFERFEEEIVVEGGSEQRLNVTLPQAYTHSGWLLGDPHSHSAPSNDASIPMADRLLVASGVGVQLHFGTDHDHVADYRPLVTALELDDYLRSVVADEVSPPLRGHMNIYPLTTDLTQPNGGAWSWWSDEIATTDLMVAGLYERHGLDTVVQINHPLDSGMASAAGWSTGTIAKADRWTDNFQAVEVLNAGQYSDYFPFYLDVLNRGGLITPVGVSDSHSHTGGAVGLNATFIGAETDLPAQFSDDALRSAMVQRKTIVTRGPYLEMSIAPGTVITEEESLSVEALTPTWMVVDRLILLKNGVETQTVLGTSATFDLSAEEDASFIVVAEGDSPMGGVWGGQTPWAVSSAILLDRLGDGWDPPLEPLEK